MRMLALALLLFASAPPDQSQSARSATPEVFALYLVAEPVDPRITGYGKGDWSQLRLSAAPLITGDDIISYEFATHSMKLRPEALARIPRPTVDGTPFIVVANGQRIYLGVFVSMVSSRSFAVPSITIDRYVFDAATSADTLVIGRAYPSTSFGAGSDPRDDERIKSALTKLGKAKTVDQFAARDR